MCLSFWQDPLLEAEGLDIRLVSAIPGTLTHLHNFDLLVCSIANIMLSVCSLLQGPLLEAEGLDIGVVSAIAAPAALEVRFYGDGGHAGALLMPYR